MIWKRRDPQVKGWWRAALGSDSVVTVVVKNHSFPTGSCRRTVLYCHISSSHVPPSGHPGIPIGYNRLIAHGAAVIISSSHFWSRTDLLRSWRYSAWCHLLEPTGHGWSWNPSNRPKWFLTLWKLTKICFKIAQKSGSSIQKLDPRAAVFLFSSLLVPWQAAPGSHDFFRDDFRDQITGITG